MSKLSKFGIDSTLNDVNSLARDVERSLERSDVERAQRTTRRLMRESRSLYEEVSQVREDMRRDGEEMVSDAIRFGVVDHILAIGSDTRLLITELRDAELADSDEDDEDREQEISSALDTVRSVLANVEQAERAWEDIVREHDA